MLSTVRPQSAIVSLTGPSIFLTHEVSDTRPNRVFLDLAVMSSNKSLGESVEPGFVAFTLAVLDLTHAIGIFLRRSCNNSILRHWPLVANRKVFSASARPRSYTGTGGPYLRLSPVQQSSRLEGPTGSILSYLGLARTTRLLLHQSP